MCGLLVAVGFVVGAVVGVLLLLGYIGHLWRGTRVG